jgi:hypothetical protein
VGELTAERELVFPFSFPFLCNTFDNKENMNKNMKSEETDKKS